MPENSPQVLPALPEIGRSESYYAHRVREADQAGDHHCHEAFKVGQYVTLAMNPHLSWDQKLRYFRHAIVRHCNPPALPDDEIWFFYRALADMIRTHAGEEALRLASLEDDMYASRIEMGQSRNAIEDDAEIFFGQLVPDACPDWFNHADYDQLKLIRDQWI